MPHAGEGGDGKADGAARTARRERARRSCMRRLPPFDAIFPTLDPRGRRRCALHRPSTAATPCVVAGGTDLYPNMKRRQQTPKVRDRAAADSRSSAGSRCAADGTLVIGAGVDADARSSAIARVRAGAIPALAHAAARDLHAAAPQHGHARRQPAARHALQLLRPELRVAQGDRLLHEEGRRHLLGRAGRARAAGRCSRPTRRRCCRARRAGGAGGARRRAEHPGRGALPRRRHRLPHQAAGRAADARSSCRRWPARARATGSCAAAARSTFRCSAWRRGRRSTERGRWPRRAIVLGAVASHPSWWRTRPPRSWAGTLEDDQLERSGAAGPSPPSRSTTPTSRIGWRKDMAPVFVRRALEGLRSVG